MFNYHNYVRGEEMSKLNKNTIVILGIIVVIAGISQRDGHNYENP